MCTFILTIIIFVPAKPVISGTYTILFLNKIYLILKEFNFCRKINKSLINGTEISQACFNVCIYK